MTTTAVERHRPELRDDELHEWESPAPPARRVTRSFTQQDFMDLAGSFAAGLALTWLLYYRLLPTDGVFGFLLCTYAASMLLYAIVCTERHDRQMVRDKLLAVVMQTAALVVLSALALVVVYTILRGRHALAHRNFFTETMSQAGPLDGLELGGILHAAVGTLIMIGISTSITVPLGVAAAVFLNEVRGPMARPLRMLVDAMSALPSIVTGLFIFAILIIPGILPRSGFAASLALSIMMLPIIIRASEVVLRLVPNGLREASLALGTSQWRTVWHVVLPTARPGLATAVILGMARGIGETSPVLLTAGFTAEMNKNPFQGSMVSLPLATFEYVKQAQPAMIERGFGAASTLLVIVMILFVIARVLGNGAPRGKSRVRRLFSPEANGSGGSR